MNIGRENTPSATENEDVKNLWAVTLIACDLEEITVTACRFNDYQVRVWKGPHGDLSPTHVDRSSATGSLLFQTWARKNPSTESLDWLVELGFKLEPFGLKAYPEVDRRRGHAYPDSLLKVADSIKGGG